MISNKSFVHTHCHSDLSAFDGLASVKSLVMTARKFGFPALALTDHGNVGGLIKFIKLCEATKDEDGNDIPYDTIKPLLGCEFYMSASRFNKSSETQPSGQGGNFHLVLIAQNWKGYQNLCSLSNFAYTEGFYFSPRIDFDLLAKHSEGLICSTACLKGIVNQNLLYDRYDAAKKVAMMFKDIFGDRFFLEVMYHGIPAELKIIPEIFKLSKELDIPVIATNDCHYVTQDQALSQEVLTCMSTRTCLSNPKRLRQVYAEFYMKSADEMYQLFKDNPNCITNTVAVANMVDHQDIKDNLFVKRMRLPEFETPDGFNSPMEFLKDLAEKGMKDLGWDKKTVYVEALEKELADIQVAKDNNNYDFATYFLIVWDIANFARKNDIFMAPGRGSAYSSVLLRCLKVCYGPPPLSEDGEGFDLLWERFLAFKTDEVTGKRVFARPGFPDIDSDFDFFRRGEIYEYIIEKYGRENVENIGTYIGLKLRMALTRTIKALDIAQAFHKGKQEFVTENMAKVEEILGQLPKAQGIFMKAKDEEGKEVPIKTIEDAIKYCPDFKYYMDKYPDIVTHTKNIQGLLSSFSKHPAGIVIADVPVHTLAPVRRSKKEQYASQYDMNDLESMGLIKLDILATSILTVIDRTVKMVKSNYGIDIDVENLNLKDEPTFELYRRGKLKGVFQCENGGMQQTMRDIGVSSFDDVVAAIALYRPGPMGSIPEYCERKKGLSPVSYFHPTIEPFVKPYLEKTHGILCVEENSLVSLFNGSQIPIKSLGVGDKIVSVNESSYKTEKDECIALKKSRFEDGYKVSLKNGYSVILTNDHKVYTWDGWKEVKDIDVDNDLIACPFFSVKSQVSKRNIASWLGRDVDVAYLLGMLTGDAQISTGITLSCGPEKNCDSLIKWLKFKLPKIKTKKFFHTRSWYIIVSCPELANWRKIGCGNRKTKLHYFLENMRLKTVGKNKCVPDIILKSSLKVQASYLAGLIDSDGCIFNNKKNEITCNVTSTSDKILSGVKRLCLNLGIFTYTTKLRVHFYNTDRLSKFISPYLVIKKIEGITTRGLMVGRIPKDYIKQKIAESGMSVRGFCTRYAINRSNIVHKRKIITNKGIGSFNVNLGDLRFYEIKSIENVGPKQFYSVSIKKNHNFLANGIVVSNCYQEQVMQICNSLAGISVTDGYILIKGIGKKKEHLISQYKVQFVSGCVSNGVPENVAEQYWDTFIIPFASYGFNMAHSSAYGFTSWISAYLKANYTAEFMICSLDVANEDKKHDKIIDLERDLKKMNIHLADRDLNNCDVNYRIVRKEDKANGIDQTVVSPSIMVKGVGLPTAQNIANNKPYESLKDLASKTDFKLVNKDTIASLAESDFFSKMIKDHYKATGKRLSKGKLVAQFMVIRNDLKKAAKKGVESMDLFG